MHLILPAPTPLDLNEGAVLAAFLFKSKAPPAGFGRATLPVAVRSLRIG